MAGQSEKKRAKEAQAYSQKHIAISLIALVVYGLARIGYRMWYLEETLSVSDYICIVASVLIYYGTFKVIVDGKLMGTSNTYYQDVFIVTLAANVVSGFTAYGWLVWMLIPIYVLYIIVRKVLDWVFTPDGPEEGSPEAELLRKRQEKMDRKLKSGRYQMVQRKM